MRSEHPEDISQALGVAIPLCDALIGDTRTPLVVLLASAAFVLLVACANLAGVQLMRALSRRREFAVRSRTWRGARAHRAASLVRERAAWSLAGGAAGLLMAMVALTELQGLAGVIPAEPRRAVARRRSDPGRSVRGLLPRGSHSAWRRHSRLRQPTRKRRCARKRAALAKLAARERCAAHSSRVSSRSASACWRAQACWAAAYGR